MKQSGLDTGHARFVNPESTLSLIRMKPLQRLLNGPQRYAPPIHPKVLRRRKAEYIAAFVLLSIFALVFVAIGIRGLFDELSWASEDVVVPFVIGFTWTILNTLALTYKWRQLKHDSPRSGGETSD